MSSNRPTMIVEAYGLIIPSVVCVALLVWWFSATPATPPACCTVIESPATPPAEEETWTRVRNGSTVRGGRR